MAPLPPVSAIWRSLFLLCWLLLYIGVHRKGRFFELARHSSTLSFPDAPDVLTPPPRTRVRCVERPGSRY